MTDDEMLILASKDVAISREQLGLSGLVNEEGLYICDESLFTFNKLFKRRRKKQMKESKDKNEKEIHIGDEVKYYGGLIVGVIVGFEKYYLGTLVFLITKDAVIYRFNSSDVEKTNRHFDHIEKLLSELEGETTNDPNC